MSQSLQGSLFGVGLSLHSVAKCWVLLGESIHEVYSFK